MDKSIFTKDHKYMVGQLRQARVAAGLNQAKVAKIIGRTQSYVSKIESGQRRIDVVQLKILAELYKKSLGFFVKK